MAAREIETRWLRIARRSRGWSQERLANEAEMTQVGISHIETGETTKPRRVTQAALARALGYTVEEVFPPKGHRSPSAELRRFEKRLHQAHDE